MNNPNSLKWGNNICGYCGKSPAPEKEHVVARCFFEKGTVTNPIIIAACQECNHGQDSNLNDDEDYTRSLFVSLPAANFHSSAKSIINGPIDRAINKKQGQISHLFKEVRLADYYTPAGIWLGTKPAFNPQWHRIWRVLEKIVRGLYYHEFGHILPNNYRISPRICFKKDGMPDLDKFLALSETMKSILNLYHIEMQEQGNYTFAYWAVVDKNSSAGMWFLSFYDGAAPCIIFVLPPEI